MPHTDPAQASGDLHPDTLSLASLIEELAQSPGTPLTMEEICDRIQEKVLASQEFALQQERSRIAREIHDGVSQNLALLILKMEIISRLADSDPPRVKDELRKVTTILESSINELRSTLNTLRSPGLGDRSTLK